MSRLSLKLCDLGRTPICELYDNTPYRARNIQEQLSINEITSLTFEMPVVPEGKWLQLKNEMLVLFNDEYYKIKTIDFQHDDSDKLYVSVSAKHYSDTLAMDLISISETTPVNVIDLMKVALCYDENDKPTLGWSVGKVTVDRVAVRGLEALEQSPFSILLTIAEKYDGILKFNSKTMTVDMLERQPTDRPVLDLRVSKNLKNFSISYDTSEMYTRLYCYGATDDNGITLDITETNPTGLGYIDNFEYFKTIGYTDEFIKAHPELFVSTNIWTDDNYYDPQDLYDDGVKELAKIAVPIVEVSVSALDTKAMGLSDEMTQLELGSCVRIYDEDLGVDTLCNVTKRTKNYEQPHILNCEVTNSVTYHDTLSRLFTDVNTVSNVVTSGGNIAGGQGGGTSMSDVKDYLNLYYLNVEQIEAKYATISDLQAYYVTSEYLQSHYIDAESIAASYATIGQLNAIEAQIEDLDVTQLKAQLAEIETLVAQYGDFHKLIATDAEIEELEAGTLTVTGLLKAADAEIDNLYATKVEAGDFEAYKATVEQLFALYASIEYLEANYLKAQQIEATYAKITSLDAIEATIETLNTSLANVETLVAKKASIEDLQAVQATIGTLQTDIANINKVIANVVTTDELNAEVGKINTLIAQKIEAINANITALDAKFATIEQLNTNIAEVKTLIADKASITDLNAAKADIGELEAGLANIETIVSGSIGTGLIQTIHLTAQNVIIDDAVIKSAMIDSLDVSKLNAGVISTNKFQVQSNDGGFKIVGNTTQWTDASGKIRMQAGRDAEGNFNFAVFGDDGTTRYFDENGIHEAGIPDGIIRDDMVADNANIQASKIQYVDKDGNKTLQTILDIQQGQIGTLIKETTIDGTSIKDKFNEIKATVDGLEITVGDVQSDVGTIQSNITQLELTTDGLKTSVTQAGTDSKEAKTIAEQTAEKFSWIVKSGTSETNFELTDRTAQLVADNINLNGLVTFSGLNSELQNHIDKGGTEHSSIVFSGKTSDKGVQLVKVQGKTVQNGTPSPDSPVEIENVEISKIISHGRQLFDASKLPTKSQGGATVTNNNDGSFTISGSGNLTDFFNKMYFDYSKEETKKLLKIGTVYGKVEADVYPAPSFMVYSNGSYTEMNLIGTSVKSINITEDMLNADDLSLRIRFYGSNNLPIKTGTVKPMIYQEGDGTFESFHENTVETNLTLAEGDTYENGQITRVRKQVTFDGSSDENWSVDQSGSVYRFFINVSDSLNSDGRSEVKCNRGMFNNNNNNIGTIFIIKKICYYIPPQDITTVEAFKTWLSTNNLVVEYELETPTTEEFKIPTIPSYEDYTYISTDSEVEPDTIIWKVLNASGSTEAIINTWNSSSVVGGTTQINGGYIQTNTISTEQLNVENIFSSGSAVMNIINAQEVNADRITSGTIKANYLELYGLNVLQVDTDITTLAIDTEGDITMRGTVESYNYVAGTSGWSIRNDGNAEFNDVVIRGDLIGSDSGVIGGTDTPEIPEVRFWAGSSYEERDSAPFRVYSDGSVEATEGTYSGVWTGDIKVGNISIVDPSVTSGGDATLTIQSGQTGVKTVELTDRDYSTFRQQLVIASDGGNNQISLNQDGTALFGTSISIGSHTTLDSDSLIINGFELGTGSNGYIFRTSQVDIGDANLASTLNIYGSSNVNGDLRANGDIYFGDVIKCTVLSNGVNFDYIV